MEDRSCDVTISRHTHNPIPLPLGGLVELGNCASQTQIRSMFCHRPSAGMHILVHTRGSALDYVFGPIGIFLCVPVFTTSCWHCPFACVTHKLNRITLGSSTGTSSRFVTAWLWAPIKQQWLFSHLSFYRLWLLQEGRSYVAMVFALCGCAFDTARPIWPI